MSLTRRQFIQASGVAMLAASPLARPFGRKERPISIVLAPNNLGLRPPRPGHEPGTWRAPDELLAAGLQAGARAKEVLRLERPAYAFDVQPGTRMRNGQSLRVFSLKLAERVRDVLQLGGFPLVVGGDCSNLLGGLYGLRRYGGRGLVHIDGHSDFYQMNARERSTTLGAAAGMDLALASGRGESLLTQWPYVRNPLVSDVDAIQIGERNSPLDRDHIPGSAIRQITVQHALKTGIGTAADQAVDFLVSRGLHRAWLHVDFDVLDQKVMPAVDSPGSPGLDFTQLSELVHVLVSSGRIAGVDFAIYDPELDPDGRYVHPLAECITRGVRG